MEQKQTTITSSSRPPVVVVLGHVDHGKTTLLDFIRKSSVTAEEAGGITQKIGAYQIELRTKNKELKKITFIDTPGHEAFSKIRSRGTNIADIAILVVSAQDGVMPQTQEAIRHIKDVGIPVIAVMNKIDLPDADITKVKQQLARANVLVEGFGGDTVVMPISAKTGQGIAELLEMILLISEMTGIKADQKGQLEGVVIESTLNKHKGPLATVIVKNGTLKLGDTVYAEDFRCKVRNLTNDLGQNIFEALPSCPVEVMGWEEIPPVGAKVSTIFTSLPEDLSVKSQSLSGLPPVETDKKLKIVLKADTLGTLEAIVDNLDKRVEIVNKNIGIIVDSDILMAKSAGCAIIGFNVQASLGTQKLAQIEKVRIKTYKIIYELLKEISEVVEILNSPQAQEIILGQAVVLAIFDFSGQKVAGCRIQEGAIARGNLVKLLRQNVQLNTARVKSIRQGKTDVDKVVKEAECGIVFDKKLDFEAEDSIIAYKIKDLL